MQPPGHFDDIDASAAEATAREARRVIDKARGRRDPLQPLPLFSWESLRIVLTCDGRFTLIRHDENGDARLGNASYAIMMAGLLLLILSFSWALTL